MESYLALAFIIGASYFIVVYPMASLVVCAVMLCLSLLASVFL